MTFDEECQAYIIYCVAISLARVGSTEIQINSKLSTYEAVALALGLIEGE